MPGRHALSAHGARKLIVKTDGQTKTEKTCMQNCGSVLNDKATYAIIIITDLDNGNPTFAASAGGKLPTLAKFVDMDSH
jgi:hypothetical protein